MCRAGPSTILYEDRLVKPCTVHWLDCSKSEPESAAEKSIIKTRQDIVWDMCFARHNGKGLLITSRSYDGIFAYNTETNKLLWRISGSLTGMVKAIGVEGITTDGQGRLFVSDYQNKCIQMFSLDGVYIKAIIQGQIQSLYQPVQIRWCNNISSLIVTHMKRKYYGISIVKETDDYSETSTCLDLSQTESLPEHAISRN